MIAYPTLKVSLPDRWATIGKSPDCQRFAYVSRHDNRVSHSPQPITSMEEMTMANVSHSTSDIIIKKLDVSLELTKGFAAPAGTPESNLELFKQIYQAVHEAEKQNRN